MNHFNRKTEKIIYFFISVFIIILIITIIFLLMLKYEVEGEKNMPFELSQIVVVSTAEGIEKEGESIWNFDLVQNNDIYIHIGKNKNYKETEIIKNIIIDNFKTNNAPKKGKLTVYKPSENEEKTYEYDEKYIINENIKYTGEENTDLKKLNIANQGGVIAFRYSNQELRSILIRRTRNKT